MKVQKINVDKIIWERYDSLCDEINEAFQGLSITHNKVLTKFLFDLDTAMEHADMGFPSGTAAYTILRDDRNKIIGLSEYWEVFNTTPSELADLSPTSKKSLPKKYVYMESLVTTGKPGAGKRLYLHMLKYASSKRLPVVLSSTKHGEGFYEHVGGAIKLTNFTTKNNIYLVPLKSVIALVKNHR